jgi:hypothetical protein
MLLRACGSRGFLNLLSLLIHLRLQRMESDSAMLCDVYEAFLQLKGTPFPDNVLTEIDGRWSFLHTSSMGMAYLLNPKNKGGEKMVEDDAENTIRELTDHLLNNKASLGISVSDDALTAELVHMLNYFANYAEQLEASGTNGLQRLQEAMDVRSWWTALGRLRFPNIYKLAIRLYAIPTSSAASERIWSVFNFEIDVYLGFVNNCVN